MHATARDLRARTARILEAVERGEEVIITYRGRPHARLVPMHREERAGEGVLHALFGIWRDRDDTADVTEWVNQLREPRF